MPYVYTGMRESTISGMPMNRSLAIDYTDDEKVFWRVYQNQYLFGPSMLIIPVESNKRITQLYLPQGGWFNFYSDQYFAGKQEITTECPLNKLPVFIKAGSLIPMQSPVQHTGEMPSDTLLVHLYRSYQEHDVEWDYYEDDGVTYQYKDGQFYSRKMKYKPAINEVVFNEKRGEAESKFKYLRLVFHGFEGENLFVKFKGKPRRLSPFTMNFQKAAELAIDTDPNTIICPSIVFPNENNSIIINW